jgi:hypothetical protein
VLYEDDKNVDLRELRATTEAAAAVVRERKFGHGA